MVLARWQATIVDESGDIQDGASVEVRRETVGAPLASLFSDRDGETPIGNPITADSAGFAAFHVAGGAYRITATKGSFSQIWRYVGVGTAGERDGAIAGPGWRFSSETASADPGSGLFRLDNATPASATAIYFDNAGELGEDLTAFLDALDDGGDAGDRGIITIRGAGDAALLVAQVTGSVTDETGYRSVPITVLSATDASTFVDDLLFGVTFSRSGADGEISGPGATTIAGQLAAFSDGLGTSIAGAGDDESPQNPAVIGTDAGVRGATPGHVIHAGHLESSNEFQDLTDAATVAVDWASFINARVVLTTDRILGNPINEIPGQWRTIEVMSDGGPDELTFGSEYEVFPTVDDIASDNSYVLNIYCLAEGRFRAYVDAGGDPT